MPRLTCRWSATNNIHSFSAPEPQSLRQSKLDSFASNSFTCAHPMYACVVFLPIIYIAIACHSTFHYTITASNVLNKHNFMHIILSVDCLPPVQFLSTTKQLHPVKQLRIPRDAADADVYSKSVARTNCTVCVWLTMYLSSYLLTSTLPPPPLHFNSNHRGWLLHYHASEGLEVHVILW